MVKPINKCATCGEPSYLLFKCRRCGEMHCEKHRIPELHDCKFKGLRNEAIPLMEFDPTTTRRFGDTSDIISEQLEDDRLDDEEKEEKIYRPAFDDEEEEEENARGQMPFQINLKSMLYMFFIFIAFDLILLVFSRSWFLSLLPIAVHVIFLPQVLYLVNQARDPDSTRETPELVQSFLKTYLIYISVYIVVKIVVSFLLFDFFSAIFFIIIGSRMIFSFWRLNSMMRAFYPR